MGEREEAGGEGDLEAGREEVKGLSPSSTRQTWSLGARPEVGGPVVGPRPGHFVPREPVLSRSGPGGRGTCRGRQARVSWKWEARRPRRGRGSPGPLDPPALKAGGGANLALGDT